MEENKMNEEMQDSNEQAGKTVSESEPAAEPKKTLIQKIMGKTKLLIGAGIAAVALIAALTVTLIVMSSPKVVFSNSLKNATRGLLERKELAPIVSMLNGGSLAIDAEVENEEQRTALSGKIYFGKNSLLISDAAYDDGSISLFGNAYLGLDYMYLESDKILGGAYGFASGNAEDTFKSSVLTEKNGDYALDEDSQIILANYLRGYDEKIYESMYKDAQRLLKKYENKLGALINKYGEFDRETTKMKLDGVRKKVRLITLTLDNDAVADIMDELYSFVSKDDKLEDFFIEYADFFEEALIASGKVAEDFDAQEAYDKFLEDFEKAIENIENSESDNTEYVIELSTPKSSSKLLKLSVSLVSDDDETELLVIDVGADGIKKSDKLTFKSDNETYVYEIRDNTASDYRAKLEYKYENSYNESYSYEKTIISIDIDKKKDKIKIALDDGETVLKGSFNSGLSKTEIVIDGVTVDGETVGDVNIGIVIKKNDSSLFGSGKLGRGDVIPFDELRADDIEKIIKKLEKTGGA